MKTITQIQLTLEPPYNKEIGWLCPSDGGKFWVLLFWNSDANDWVPITIPFSKEELEKIIKDLLSDPEFEYPQGFYDRLKELINEYLKDAQIYEPGTGIAFSEPNPETGKITISSTLEGVLHLLGVLNGTPQDLPEASLDNYGGVYVLPMYDSESETNIFQEYACTRTETTTTDPDTGEETTEYSYRWELLGAVNDFSGWAENIGFAYTGSVDAITSIDGDKNKDGMTYPNVDQVLNKIISKVWFTEPEVTISASMDSVVEVGTTLSNVDIAVTATGSTNAITSLTLEGDITKSYTAYEDLEADNNKPRTKSLTSDEATKIAVATLTGKYTDGDGEIKNLEASKIEVTWAYKWYHGATSSSDYATLLKDGGLLSKSSMVIDRPQYGGSTDFVIITQKSIKTLIDKATNADFMQLESKTHITTSITRNGKQTTYNVYSFKSDAMLGYNEDGFTVTFN